MTDYIIVGAGIAGTVVARQMAEKGYKVLVLEKRNHIAGNCYDAKDKYGILIHKYGPHIFHTNLEHVQEYLSKFTDWYCFKHKVIAKVSDNFFTVPFNLNTIEQVFKKSEIKDKLINLYGMENQVSILELMNSKDEDLHLVGKFVYDNIYLYYTMKQWGKKPQEIDPAVTARVPVRISYDDGYFSDKYQGVPLDGFTSMFEKMLSHKNISVQLTSDAKDVLKITDKEILYNNAIFNGKVIFTGQIDEFFDCCYGKLPYRTLRFEFEHYKQANYQRNSVINYTVSEDYTRVTEYKLLTGQKCEETTISKEYPSDYLDSKTEIPYYAISNENNQLLYNKYADKIVNKNFYLLGRLAEYKYYNIDIVVDRALQLSENI